MRPELVAGPRRDEFPGQRMGIRVLARDIGFTEGPVWTGAAIVVTSITRGQLYEMSLGGGDARVLAEPGGGPNGLAYDPSAGRFWIAQNGRKHMPPRADVARRVPGIQWCEAGEVATLLEKPGSAPNDCVVGPDGRLWFTNPSGDPHEGRPETGQVCALDVGRGEVEVVLETDGYPNGLAFGVDPDQLFVAETRYARVVEHRRTGDGRFVAGQVFQLVRGFPDGIALAADGGLWVTGTSSGTVEVFTPSGRTVDRIDFGADSMPTNLCFAGAGLDELVVTLAKGGRVVALDPGCTGLPLTDAIR
jgi:gluconolactonase